MYIIFLCSFPSGQSGAPGGGANPGGQGGQYNNPDGDDLYE